MILHKTIMEQWLYKRLREEDSSINPSFSLLGTKNWLQALSILCSSGNFEPDKLTEKYASIERRKVSKKDDTLAFEQMLMSFHQLAALKAITKSCNAPYDFIRLAIVAWYYGVFYAGSAMIAACDGSHQDDHRATANTWDSQIAKTGLAVSPFAFRVSTLIPKEYEAEIKALRGGVNHDPREPASDPTQALGSCCSYLKGTCDWWREKSEENIKSDKKFKQAGFSNFKPVAARQWRDEKLKNKTVGFLHQAIRYRGKANYRDALYLSYGSNQADDIRQLTEHLYLTLNAFIRMTSHYCSKRVEKGTWREFILDLENHGLLQHDLEVMRVNG